MRLDSEAILRALKNKINGDALKRDLEPWPLLEWLEAVGEENLEEIRMSRFDNVRYDDIAASKQKIGRNRCEALEAFVDSELEPGRAKALALTALEECYTWVGKAIRDDQVVRQMGGVK